MSKRWNNQTQDWETDVVETKEEWVAPDSVEWPPEELPPLETFVDGVVELPPVVVPEEFGNVELVEIPIEVVNAKSSHWVDPIGFEALYGVLGIIVLVVAWRWLKK